MSAARDRGTAAETAVVRYLNDRGIPCDRSPLRGAADQGDISGLPVVIEVKDQVRLQLAEWSDEAKREGARAGKPGVLWHKRRGKGSPGDWYVTMDGHSFVLFLEAIQEVIR